jgi:hypothetical protein
MDFQFSNYETEEQRGIGDEQVRAFVGERLAELPAVEIDSLSVEQRALYDRVLLRCEFANQLAVAKFSHHATPQSIAKTHEADMEIIAAAREINVQHATLDDTLKRLEEAFDKRDKAMLGQ